jgi:LAO/AO transport system kinase
MRTRRDLSAALRSLGSRSTPVLAVSSLPPASGVRELADALEEHRAVIDIAARRLHSRRSAALSEFLAEHGEHGLRAVGGRGGAERRLAEEDPGLEVLALVAVLERATR